MRWGGTEPGLETFQVRLSPGPSQGQSRGDVTLLPWVPRGPRALSPHTPVQAPTGSPLVCACTQTQTDACVTPWLYKTHTRVCTRTYVTFTYISKVTPTAAPASREARLSPGAAEACRPWAKRLGATSGLLEARGPSGLSWPFPGPGVGSRPRQACPGTGLYQSPALSVVSVVRVPREACEQRPGSGCVLALHLPHERRAPFPLKNLPLQGSLVCSKAPFSC